MKLVEKVYLNIKNDIKNKYSIGDVLPSEQTYSEEFGVSKLTTKNAYQRLMREGYLTRTRGKGSVIISKISYVRYLSKKVVNKGEEKIKKVIDIQKIEFDELPENAKDSFSKKDSIWKLTRKSFYKNNKSITHITWFINNIDRPNFNDFKDGFYSYLEDKKGIQLSSFKEKIFTSNNDIFNSYRDELEEILIIRERKTFDDKENVVEYSMSSYPIDLFNIQITYGKGAQEWKGK